MTATQNKGLKAPLGKELEGRVAIITGAAMGIGRACAKIMAQQGATLIIADRNANAGADCVSEMRQFGTSVRYIQTDVSEMVGMQHLAAQTIDWFGGIDILVNNAALAISGHVHDMSESEWSTTLSVNLSGVWRAMKVCLPHMMQRQRGSIINISSTQALRGYKGWSAYAAAKGGVNALTQQAAVDLADYGIRVNAVAPGTIMTPMNQQILSESDDPDALMETWKNAHPLGRCGEAEEVAEAVMFLASDRASFITGEILRVDGGQVIKGG